MLLGGVTIIATLKLSEDVAANIMPATVHASASTAAAIVKSIPADGNQLKPHIENATERGNGSGLRIIAKSIPASEGLHVKSGMRKIRSVYLPKHVAAGLGYTMCPSMISLSQIGRLF